MKTSDSQRHFEVKEVSNGLKGNICKYVPKKVFFPEYINSVIRRKASKFDK